MVSVPWLTQAPTNWAIDCMNWNIIKAGPRIALGATSATYIRHAIQSVSDGSRDEYWSFCKHTGCELSNTKTNEDSADVKDTSDAVGTDLDDSSNDDAASSAGKHGLAAKLIVDRCRSKSSTELSDIDDRGADGQESGSELVGTICLLDSIVASKVLHSLDAGVVDCLMSGQLMVSCDPFLCVVAHHNHSRGRQSLPPGSKRLPICALSS